MTNDDLTGVLAGEGHTTPPGIPQRIAGGTFAGEDLSEVVADRGARHIELDGGDR